MAREAILGWISADLEALLPSLSMLAAVGGAGLAANRCWLPKRGSPVLVSYSDRLGSLWFSEMVFVSYISLRDISVI
jgi:hypothetical protein